MPLLDFPQGSVICSAGMPLERLLIITKGKAQGAFGGKEFAFEQGDAIGISAISTGVYAHTYTAVTDVTAFSYPYEKPDDLLPLLKDNAEIANRLLSSLCHKIVGFLQYRKELEEQVVRAYGLATETYAEYSRMCARFAVAAKILPEAEELAEPAALDLSEVCLHEYYTGIRDLDVAVQKALFGNPGIALGFIHKGAADIAQILNACEIYQDYMKNAVKVLLNDDEHDLFSLVSDLHLNSAGIKAADAATKAFLDPMMEFMAASPFIDKGILHARLSTYRDNLSSGQSSARATGKGAAAGNQNLADSLHVILEYSGLPEDVCNKFSRCVHDFTKVPDRGSSDDAVYALRRELAATFYDIYRQVFVKSLEDNNLPTIIKMFLNFGYMDAALAGQENAEFLYSIADSLKGNADIGVYTLREWLAAVYTGKKDPSRNDFDEDYPTFVREMRVSGRIDTKEEERMLNDGMGKLMFEMEHVMPVVNKITFGRMATFCPVFADTNVQKHLPSSIVKPEAIKQALDEIRTVDFSAYSRSVLYYNEDAGIQKEFVHVEYLPDFILMPNLGTRGAMWQEIEGRKRTTPSRMFLPLFLMNDIKALLMRLTAEFRWEMCKREQGARWNDMSDPSLTSEFFDYLQFYRSNRELSAEVKTTVKAELLRAKNVYKAVFVLNYADWLMYESKGSPRLNKFVRKIMMTYCPFTAEVRDKLTLNPQYAEVLKYFELKRSQREKRLANVIAKAMNLSKDKPVELLAEMEFVKK